MMKADYALKKFQKYITSLSQNEKFLFGIKKIQILYCKDQFIYNPVNKKVFIAGLGDFEIENDSMKNKEMDFLIIENIMNDYFLTFYSFKGNPYGKDSPLIQEDGFIHAIPGSIEIDRKDQ